MLLPSTAPLRRARLHAHASAHACPQAASSPPCRPLEAAKTALRAPVSKQQRSENLAKAQRSHRAHVVLRKPAPSPSPPQQPGWRACNARGVTSARTCTTAFVKTAPRTLPQHTSEKCRTPRKSNRFAAQPAGARWARHSKGMDRMSPRCLRSARRALLSRQLPASTVRVRYDKVWSEHHFLMHFGALERVQGQRIPEPMGLIRWDPLGLDSLTLFSST